jgi:hypothetical protein
MHGCSVKSMVYGYGSENFLLKWAEKKVRYGSVGFVLGAELYAMRVLT